MMLTKFQASSKEFTSIWYIFCRIYKVNISLKQSHWPNWHETDSKPTTIIKFGEKSVWVRYWFSVSKNCRLPVGYMLVWCRFCQEAFADMSVFIRPLMAHGLLVYIGHALSICRLTWHPLKTNLDGTKSHITPNCGEWSNIVPTQDRHVSDMSGTQT